MARTQKPLVLFADDQPDMRRILERTLWWGGFDVVEAKDGVEALARASAWRPPIAILDALMPHLHGFEVCREMKKIDAAYRPRVLILTAVYKSVHYRNEAWKDFGADAYLLKPIRPVEVATAVRLELDWLERNDPEQLERELPAPAGAPAGETAGAAAGF